ncbi:MAG: HD domain-containing protein [Proteobacteria bacterium]|nr:HD domain-containing protein [Pseudomonadota bacterium]
MKCPGQDLRYWKPEDIFDFSCPQCGKEIEFFKDDVRRRCKSCGAQVTNPKIDFGCAEWCDYAEQCVGNLPGELKEKRREFLRSRIALEIRKVFGTDRKCINHAVKVARFAEEILKGEGGDPAVVIAASYLHDIGIHEAERKYNSTVGDYQEREGPPIARGILERLGVDRETIDEVCDLIAHHHSPGNIKTLNFQILWEADSLANFEEATEKERDQAKEIIERTFRTTTGKRLAQTLLLDGRDSPS